MDFIDPGIKDYEDATTFSMGVDAEVGPGVLSVGLGTIPNWNAAKQFDNAGTAYEVYYDYQITDGLSIKPGIMTTSIDNAVGYDSTRFAVETTFKF